MERIFHTSGCNATSVVPSPAPPVRAGRRSCRPRNFLLSAPFRGPAPGKRRLSFATDQMQQRPANKPGKRPDKAPVTSEHAPGPHVRTENPRGSGQDGSIGPHRRNLDVPGRFAISGCIIPIFKNMFRLPGVSRSLTFTATRTFVKFENCYLLDCSKRWPPLGIR